MTTRSIFNRRYTSYTPGSTQVWLVNGAGVTTTTSTTLELTAGENLIQGQVVYVSGTYALSASAASGVTPAEFNPIGVATANAPLNSGVAVVYDGIATLTQFNITDAATLNTGQYYYLSKETGRVTQTPPISGSLTYSGGYAALVPIGLALSTTELHVEIGTPAVLTEQGYTEDKDFLP